ncbi:MAG TPA: sigma-70 family RNA polymerase sigma factor [Blastocatellia bacterium]|nr:sigma-70 family RNA polymerase sigma factor [Blastocatellia bacterium]
MNEKDFLAERFEESRSHLRAVAYRMLGSMSEAEDAVQESWLRLSRSDAGAIENLGGWLTTVVARVCLDMLRSRKSRSEEPLDSNLARSIASGEGPGDPEREAVMADSVGLALLVVLDTLNPAERLAFVLHDLFALSFEEIGEIVGRTAAATRQLASRARRRVRGPGSIPQADLKRQRKVADSFLAALRAADFEGLVAVLDPDVVVRIDSSAVALGAPTEVRGARNWAKGAIAFARGARFTQTALVDGTVGVVVAPRGRLFRVLKFTIVGDKIVNAEVIADPDRLRQLTIGVLD